MLLSLLLSLSSPQAGAPASPLADPKWVIREVVPGRSDFQYADRRWSQAITLLGDTDDDGMSEFAAVAFDYPSPSGSGWQGENWRGWMRFGKAGHERRFTVEEHYPFPQSILLSSGSGKTLLRSPLGELSGHPVYGSPNFSTWLPPNFSLPLATATVPGTVYYRFPDRNADGYDEVLRQHRDGATGANTATMLDGVTLAEIWRYADTSFRGVHGENFSPASVEPWPDLNGDQSPDVIAAWTDWSGAYASAVILALDGSSGQLIWRYEHPPAVPATFPVADCPDITGDGVTDIVLGLTGAANKIIMLNGATGFPVWSQDMQAILSPMAPPGHRYIKFNFVLVPTKVPGNPGEVDLLLEVIYEPFWWWVLPDLHRFAHLDARTGILRGFVLEPKSLAPWQPDEFNTFYGPHGPMRIGDWDRDGLVECVTVSNGPSMDLPNNNWNPVHLVILGMETLRVPAHQSIGTNFEAGVMIPSAPNYDFTLLLSQGFERAGGQLIDGWRTFLAPDSLLFHTRSGLYSGRLDQDGNGSVRVTLPPNPSLSGTTLYSKAVIWKPSSRSEVWTMSSLGVTEIR